MPAQAAAFRATYEKSEKFCLFLLTYGGVRADTESATRRKDTHMTTTPHTSRETIDQGTESTPRSPRATPHRRLTDECATLTRVRQAVPPQRMTSRHTSWAMRGSELIRAKFNRALDKASTGPRSVAQRQGRPGPLPVFYRQRRNHGGYHAEHRRVPNHHRRVSRRNPRRGRMAARQLRPGRTRP